MSHFDWYSGSYRGDHRVVVGAVIQNFDALAEGPISRGRHCFAHALRLRADHGLACTVQWGGDLHGDLVHTAFSGWRSGEGASLLRHVLPEHRISRVDVAEDLCGPGAYSQLQRLSARVARHHNLKRSRIVPDNPLSGRTVYLGSRTSTVFVRIYEKGKQVLSCGESGALTVDAQQLGVDLKGFPIETWARCEVEVKPKAHARAELSRLSPEAFWGCSSWTADLYRDLSGADIPRINVGSVWQADDLSRTVRSMLNQYGRTLERLHADLGSWECVGLQLGHELSQIKNPTPRGDGAE